MMKDDFPEFEKYAEVVFISMLWIMPEYRQRVDRLEASNLHFFLADRGSGLDRFRRHFL